MSTKEIANDTFFACVESIIQLGNSVEIMVKGTSMHPTLLSGKHKVLLIPYEKKYLRVGIIALFVYRNQHVLHRLVSINHDQLIFQGDNLPYTQEHVKERDIIAIAEFIIPPKGKIIDCKKQWFFTKSRILKPLQRYRQLIVGKIKNFSFLKTCLNLR